MHPLLGIFLFLAWFGAGVAASLLLSGFAALTSLGDMGSPPMTYWLTVVASWSVVPLWLSFGWVPCAWRAWRDKPTRLMSGLIAGSQVFVFLMTFVLLDMLRPSL